MIVMPIPIGGASSLLGSIIMLCIYIIALIVVLLVWLDSSLMIQNYSGSLFNKLKQWKAYKEKKKQERIELENKLDRKKRIEEESYSTIKELREKGLL